MPSDPTKTAPEAGCALKDMKFDGGKPLAGIPFQDFPRALLAVAEIGTFGAKKYSRSSWKSVPDALTRYLDAKFRHILMGQTEKYDQESGMRHAAHEAWNALATLELMIEQDEKNTQAGVWTPKPGEYFPAIGTSLVRDR